MPDLLHTPLYNQHIERNAKMAEFAGYSMPIQYSGIIEEHNWVRRNCGIFDVSHMGQIIVEGEGAAEFLETITPSDILDIDDFQCVYTTILNQNAGIQDDIIITRQAENKFSIVLNASRKKSDVEYLKKHLPAAVTLTEITDRGIIAIQGPQAKNIVEELLAKDFDGLKSMHGIKVEIFGEECLTTRTGYTGEDGFEIAAPNTIIEKLWRTFLRHDLVKPIGLGARDSLRLGAGFPLFGQDIDETTSPLEASLSWIIRSKRLEKCICYNQLKSEIKMGSSHKRVGIKPIGKGIPRSGNKVYIGEVQIGVVSSGGFSPRLQHAIAQGYVAAKYSATGTLIDVEIRGKKVQAEVTGLRFFRRK